MNKKYEYKDIYIKSEKKLWIKNLSSLNMNIYIKT